MEATPRRPFFIPHLWGYLEGGWSQKVRSEELPELMVPNTSFDGVNDLLAWAKPLDTIVSTAKFHDWLGALDSLRTFCIAPPSEFPFQKIWKLVG